MLRKRVLDQIGITDGGKSLKNIIFDLGGVIIDIHYEDTIKAFKKFGFTDFDTIYTQMKHTHLFDLLETGKIPAKAFRIELQKFCKKLTDEQIDTAWNTMIGKMSASHLTLLKSVRKHYHTFLLSNTNLIHIDYFEKYLQKTFGNNPLGEMFEKVYYSHEIGYRKPARESYEAVLNDSALIASETLFIDDLLVNVKGANEVGMYAYHLQNETIEDLFE